MTMSEGNFGDHVYVAILPILMTENEDGTNIVNWNARAFDVQELARRIADRIAEARTEWDEEA